MALGSHGRGTGLPLCVEVMIALPYRDCKLVVLDSIDYPAAQLPAGRVDLIALAVADLHVQSAGTQDL